MAALIYRSPQVQSGIIYLGDSCLGYRAEHCCGRCRKDGKTRCEHEWCCMARLMKRCGMTAHRAKYDLADAGLVKLHNAGRRLCPCSRCGGDATRKAGGSTLDADGRLVGAATGYELDPTLFESAAPSNPAAQRSGRPNAAAARPYRSPAERRILEEGRAKLRGAMEELERKRAGP